MIADIATHRDELRELCRRFHVRRLDVFGSAARAVDFDPARSDLDFLVEFELVELAAYFDVFFGLKELLETLFGRKVDLVEAGAVRNSYMKASIERSREWVY